MRAVLEVKDLCKSFGELRAVNKVSFNVAEKEIFGIAGPNGAGKTTLFNIISGIPFGPDSGSIFFKNRPIANLKPHHICNLGIARTFQKETTFRSMTIYENLKVSAWYGNNSPGSRNIDNKIEESLYIVGLQAGRGSECDLLSLYDKKRLMLASALVTNPELLLLDEPASGLNQVEINQLIELVKRLNTLGIAIVLIEHVLPLLLTVSNRVMILNQGVKIAEDSPGRIVANQQVIEAYLGSGKYGKLIAGNK